MNTTEAKDFLAKLDLEAAKFHEFPQPQALLDAINKTGAADQQAAMRPLFTEKFQQICEGVDLEGFKRHDVLSACSVRATPTSFRDYTSRAALIAMTLGLQTKSDYWDSLRDRSDAVSLSEHPIGVSVGLGIHVWKNAHNIHDFLASNGLTRVKPGIGKRWIDDTMHAILKHTVDCIDVIAADVLASMGAAAPVVKTMGASIVLSGSPSPATAILDTSTSDEPDFSAIDLKAGLGLFALLSRPELGYDSTDVLHAINLLPGLDKEAASAIQNLVMISLDRKNVIDEPDSISEIMATAIIWLNKKLANPTSEDSESEPAPSGPSYTVPSALHSTINAILSSAALPNIESMIAEIDEGKAKFSEAEKKLEKLSTTALRKTAMKFDPSGALPSGGATWENAYTVLRKAGLAIPSKKKRLFDFDVPFFTWDAPHRDVPVIDPDYRWRWDILAQLLWGLAYNKKPWIWGHTGTGKTTLIEQVAAILNWPFCRINFDSEITRMDLVGRDTLRTDEHGNTISVFQDGILPQAMVSPSIICNDELDFVRSDIAYVYQRALEDKGLLLTEDGGRLIIPHEYCRMVATANTQGQGDEFGLYQGARVQSQAFLDRFQCWIEVPYLDSASERKLIEAKVPALPADMITRVVNYVKEHREAFKQATILKPISPRGVVSLSEALLFFTKLHATGEESKGVTLALNTTILGSVTHADAAKINELIDRTFN